MTEEERMKLVEEIADYIIETKCSTRVAASFFHVSNYTVSDYMSRRLPKINSRKYNQVKEILEKNKPQGIEKDSVLKRVIQASYLLLDGLTVEEIALKLNTTKDVITRDLTVRLPKVSQEDYETLKEQLKLHKEANLELGQERKIPIEERDSLGRFQSKK